MKLTYKNVKVGDVVEVWLGDVLRLAIIRKIGVVQGAWRMATLDIGGEIAYVPLHEFEVGP